MKRDFSFSEVKKYLENKSAAESILDGFSTFSDVAIIFTPIVFGPQFLPLLEVLDAKDRLVEAGKKLLSFIESQTAPDYKEKMQQIDSAYVTLSLTAFVEALRENLPSAEIKEVIKYFKDNERLEQSSNEPRTDISEKSKSINIMFPNEVDSLDDVQKSLRTFYEGTCKNLIDHFEKVISKLDGGEKTSKQSKKMVSKIKNIINGLRQIPENALSVYTAQLVDLMSSFPDFSAYVQLREFASLRTAIKQSGKQKTAYDIGLKSLADLIRSISKTQKEEETEKICEDLKKHYKKEIEKPIVGGSDASGDELAGGVTTEGEHEDLSFPSIVDAYISQAYKCLRYTGSTGLEKPKAWESLPLNENIGDFFVNYLSLPQSVEYPLIVLGLPGSGKSILTKILAAQLMDSAYTVVRIPLRDIDASNDIHVVISEQIAKDIHRPLKDGYGGFADHFINDPLLIIFDGYDELLQVKGDIFNGYISKIHEFQKEQSGLGKPVRVMITSRVTLIDKVKIPKNSVIVNLEAFDQSRRNAWINIWNKYNKEYFSRNNVKPFYLKEDKELSENVKELAVQPLLLLMLALFDSYGNALESMGDNMSRTHLYDQLLRRICRREANKLYTIKQGDVDAFVDKYVQGEMSRLGVVAIGMFNRNLLHINTKDVLSDLLTYKILNEWGETPTEADNLIRSFFFVHKSVTDNENESKKDYAYEFLHNTFGEFLAADFILNYLVREAGELFSAQKNSKMQGNIVQKKLYDPNGLGDEWFINLMFNPLYSRPLVVEMIREHLPCVLNHYAFGMEDFQSSLIELVETQLKMFLEEKNLPSVLRHLDGFKDIKLPLIGHISTYTLNITILASLLSDKGFDFDERNYKTDTSQESETSPWDKLTNLWKTWFSSDNLTGLARIIRSNRTVVDDNNKLSKITLSCPTKIDDVESGLNKIEKQLSVANALSDQMVIALSGLQTTRFTDITKKKTDDILSILKSVNQNLYVRHIINLIRRELYSTPDNRKFDNINELINLVLGIDSFDELNLDVIIEYLVIIEVLLSRHLVYLEIQKYIFKQLNDFIRRIEPRNDYFILVNRIAIKLSRNLDEFFDSEEMHHFRKNMPFPIRDIHDNSDSLFSFHENEMLYDKKSRRFALDFDDDKRFLFLSEENIFMYMRTDPEMVSRYLLSISRRMRTQNKEFYSIAHEYFRYIHSCFRNRENISEREYYVLKHERFSDWKHDEFIRSNHIDDIRFSRYPMIGLRTLIYSIQIATNINDKEYQHITRDMVRERLYHHNRRSEYFASIMFSSPELFIITIENIPEIFDRKHFEYFGRDMEHFFERSFSRNISIHLAVAYVKLIKNANLNHDAHITEFHHMMFKIISQAICDFVESDRDICDVLTVNEYENLMWYLEINENEFGRIVIEKIRRRQHN